MTSSTSECACTKTCDPAPQTCQEQPRRPKADCDPEKEDVEDECNGKDDDCDGDVDEGCGGGLAGGPGGGGPGGGPGGPPPPPPPPDPRCKEGNVGVDPILLSARAAITEAYVDFAVEHVSRLSLSRTYSSASAAVRGGGPVGPLGRGWSHEWDLGLSCHGDACAVRFGAGEGLIFGPPRRVASVDGSEMLDVYLPFSASTRGLLVRRPSGLWRLFLEDGREMQFDTVCDACDAADERSRRCLDPRLGGEARLVAVVDSTGNSVSVRYDRPGGVLLGISDTLGHSLELRGPAACSAGLATELWFGPVQVASYDYEGLDLVRVTDGDGATMRSYAYLPSSNGLLQAVMDESSAPIVEFSYDADGQAIGIADERTLASVVYGEGGAVTVSEQYRGVDGDAMASHGRQLDDAGRVTWVGQGCGPGGARSFGYAGPALVCSVNAAGRVHYRVLDASGRVARVVEYPGQACPSSPSELRGPGYLPAGSRDTSYAYSGVAARTIAQGISLDLARVGTETRVSDYFPGYFVTSTADYDQRPAAIDPPGYRCAESLLPAASVICRKVESGRVIGTTGGYVLEQHATFFSYDSHGRLVRTYGPLTVGEASPAPIPLEERAYWPDDATPERRGRLKEIRRHPGNGLAPHVESYDYDLFGVFQSTSPGGEVTTVVRDGRGRAVRIITLAGVLEQRFHDGEIPRVVVRPGGGGADRYDYDDRGRVTVVEHWSGDPEAAGAPILRWSEHHVYDPAGNVVHTERRDATGVATWKEDRAYDAQHRPVHEASPTDPGRARTWAYTTTGQLGSETDEEGRTLSFEHDPLGRVTLVRRSGLNSQGAPVSTAMARYDYGAASEAIAAVTDGKGGKVSYRHDDFGRVERVSSPNLYGGEVLYRYDARGNVTERTERFARVTYAYDGLDRLVALTATNTFVQRAISYTFRYDEDGQVGLTSIVEPERITRLEYDAQGRTTAEAITEQGFAVPIVTRYTYDPEGRLATITYPSGLVIRYIGDPATGEVTGVVEEGGAAFASGGAHLPGGPLTAVLLGNGLPVHRTFDLRHGPVQHESGPLVLRYTPTPAGNVGRIEDRSAGLPTAGADHTFTYDHLDRLLVSPGWLEYGYDGAGNRVSQAGPGPATAQYVYSNDQVMERRVAGGQTIYFGYGIFADLGGMRWTTPGGWQSAVCLVHDPLHRFTLFGYASQGRVISGSACAQESEVSTPVARFRYDARNRRVGREDPATGTVRYTVFDTAGNPLSELAPPASPQGTWTRVRDYVWFDGSPVTQIEYGGAGAGSRYYVHADQIGLPRALTNAAGDVVWSAIPTPYGELDETTVPDPQTGRTIVTNLRLPGQYDERLFGPLGLQGPYYNWNRWYLPGVGRYLEPDPVAMEGKFNAEFGPDWYSYVSGNPLSRTDPAGLHDPGTCRNAGTGCDECAAAASQITDPKLRACVQAQCKDVNVKVCCSRDCKGNKKAACGPVAKPGKPFKAGAAPIGSGDDPTQVVYWCEQPIDERCQNLLMVHELAHTCGWKDGDNTKGVPVDPVCEIHEQ